MNLLTLDEVATALKVHENTVLRIITKTKELSAIKVSGQWRIKEEALEDYLESRTVKASKRKSATFKS